MKLPRSRRLFGMLGGGILALLSACAGVAVDGSVGVGYDAGYYEPYGYEYGGWGGGYRVGPGWHDRGGGAGHYRAAPAGRAVPSIPHGSRGAGSRGSRH